MGKELSDLVKNTLLVVGALFPIVDPLAGAPIFLSLTRRLSSRSRAKLAQIIAVDGLILILASIFIGAYVLAFFGISLPVVQVGGGLVVIATGWKLLNQSDDSEADNAGAEDCKETDLKKQAFYPLTMPLTVGPGSISVAITVGASRHEGSEWYWPLVGGMIIGSIVIAISVYLCYRFADRLAAVLGDAAMNTFIRLSSFILVCIGVQILWNGLSTLLKSVIVPR